MNRLSSESINKICSSQAIVTLSAAVKELIENSLDAKATSIEIRMGEWGVESLVVLDNGSGIGPENHKSICSKGSTSKIEEFEDIALADSYGFRGDALSALASLCTDPLEIITCQQAPVGFKLLYSEMGELISSSKMARSKGTTVKCSNLFAALPVRAQEFKKNARKFFNECLDMVHSYCLSNTSVRFIMSNLSSKGGKTVYIQTSGTGDLVSTISSLFGAKVASSGMTISETVAADSISFRFAGILAKPRAGCGRSDSDIQFLFVNGRPIRMPKLKRILKQVYREFNPNQNPWYALFFTIQSDKFDRNVSPDKLTLILEDEDGILRHCQSRLQDLLEPYRGEFVGNAASLAKSRQTELNIGAEVSTSGNHQARQLPESQSSASGSKSKRLPFRRSMAVDSQVSLKVDMARITATCSGLGNLQGENRYSFSSGNLETPLFIHKSDFGSMKVIGQFNLGFILVSFHSHLFIVDQHASEEKYLFEKFRDETKIISQSLISPKELFLTPQQQSLVERYQEQLKNQGFVVARDSNSGSDQWSLVAVPHLKNVVFDKSDLEELIQEMTDQPIILPICKRMRAYFASRACRTAVMIGDALSLMEMKKIIGNMESVKQPWNCPHGRPTIRFLLKFSR